MTTRLKLLASRDCGSAILELQPKNIGRGERLRAPNFSLGAKIFGWAALPCLGNTRAPRVAVGALADRVQTHPKSDAFTPAISRLLLPVFLSILQLTTACETKTRARLEAQRAYLAGEAQAADQARAQPPVVLVKGQVVNSIIPWTPNLTLAHAINAADYTGYLNPRLIRVTHDGQTSEIKPGDLLNGQDLPVQPGDTIEIVQ